MVQGLFCGAVGLAGNGRCWSAWCVFAQNGGFGGVAAGGGGNGRSGYSLLIWLRKRGNFPTQDALFFTAGLLGWGVLFLTLPASDLVWQLVGPLRGLQFPWRLLDVPAFFLPIAALGIFYRGERGGRGEKEKSLRSPRSLRLIISTIALALVVLVSYVNLAPYLYPPRWTDLPERPSLADVTAVQQQYQIIGLTAWGEYSDARVTEWPTGPVVAAGASLADKLVTAVPPNNLNLQESDPWTAVWQTSFPEPTTLTFASHIFPGWQARLDGDDLAVGADENGRLQLTIPAGEHTLKVWFGRTPVRWLADFVSVAGLLVCLWLVVVGDQRLEIGDWQASPISNLQSPISFSVFVAGLALLLLLGKVFWLDQTIRRWWCRWQTAVFPTFPAPPQATLAMKSSLSA